MSPSAAIYQRIFRDIPTITFIYHYFFGTPGTLLHFLTDMDLPKNGGYLKKICPCWENDDQP